MSSTFLERLRTAMTNAGLNQNMLAEAAGVSIGAISGYMNGKLRPSQTRLEALAKATGVTVEYLTAGDDREQIPVSDNDWKIPVGLGRITLAKAARCLRMSPKYVKLGMLNGTLPIGYVIPLPGTRDEIVITPEKLCEAAGATRFHECFG